MKKDWFDIAYNKWLNDQAVKDDEAIWGNIQDELDFEDTWENIANELDKKDRKRGVWIPLKYTLIAALVFGVSFSVFHFLNTKSEGQIISEKVRVNEEGKSTTIKPGELSVLNNYDSTKGSQYELKTNVLHQFKNPSNFSGDKFENNLLSFEGKQEVNKQLKTQQAIKKSIFEQEEDFKKEGDLEKSNLRQEESYLFDASLAGFTFISLDIDSLQNAHQLAQVTLSKVDLNTDSLAELPKVKAKSKKGAFRIVDAGLIYGFKNTWLLNNETRNGFNPNKLNNTLFTFYQDLGISTTFEIKHKHQFAVDFFWKSQSGQNYQEYINAAYTNRNIKLEYLRLQLLYYINWDKLMGQGIIGSYFSKLTLAEEQIASSSFNITGDYRKHDYGLVAGYQFNIYLSKKIVLKPGLRVNYNLMNVFNGNDLIPSSLNQTKNLSNSLNISLMYNFD